MPYYRVMEWIPRFPAGALSWTIACFILLLPALVPSQQGKIVDQEQQPAPPPAHPPRKRRRWARWIISTVVLLLLIESAIEPSLLTVTRVTFPMRAIPPGTELRIVHLSDLHITTKARIHRRLVDTVATESPTLIVMTGDQLSDPREGERFPAARELFTQLSTIAPVVMVLGNHEEYMPETSFRWLLLRNETVDVDLRGVPLRITGWERPYHLPEGDAWPPPLLGTAPDRVNILLVHSPDSIPEAAAQGMDLALAGHTHGGQVRLPFWGAVLTFCITGKRFEYGPYHLGQTNAFVSRGVSQNPLPTPPVRFLCPPEVAVITLRHGE